MDDLNELYHQDFLRHAALLETLDDTVRLDAKEREAVQQAVRVMRALAEHANAAAPLVALLANEDAQKQKQQARVRSGIIWARIDNIVRQATTDTFNLGRVSREMVDAASALGEASSRLHDRLEPGREDPAAMDEIEAVSHQLRSAAKALSGSTPTAIKVNHDGLEKILAQWAPIRSVDMLHERFTRLGIAWEEPAPDLPLRAIQARC